MAEERLYLLGLTETAGIEVAALALDRADVTPADCAWQVADRGPLGLAIALALPAEAAQALLEEAAATRPGLRLQSTPPEGQTFDFSEGLLLLLQPRPGAPGDWAPVENEHLVVAEGADAERAQALFREISFAATATRVAAAARGEERLWLFHVLDDEGRKSTFHGAMRSGALAGCHVLRAWREEGMSLFFPEAARPSRGPFIALHRLLARHPEVLGGARPAAGPLLAGIPHADQVRILWLAQLNFVDEVQLQPSAEALPTVALLPLTDAAEEMQSLRLRIAAAGPRAGYPLELRPAPPAAAGSSERIRLRQRLAETRQRLAYLESLDQTHPVLYRFPQSELESLAALLASFPVDALKQGDLLYGFYADETEPSGCHFLLVDPEHALAARLDPLATGTDSRISHYQLDPLWAGIYYEPDRPSLVFTPFGQRLFPSMHAWNAREMDQYLADSVQAWQAAHGLGPETPPERPLYVFDTDSRRHDGSLRLSVLDRERFAPLHQRMGWINDNLLVTRDLGLEDTISTLADAIQREAMLDRKHRDVASRQEQFEASLAGLNEQVRQETQTFLRVLGERIHQSLEQVGTARSELDELEVSLGRLQELRGDIHRMHRKTLRKVEVSLQDLPPDLRRLKRAMERLIANAEQEREALRSNMVDEVAQLGQRRRNLVKSIKRELWLGEGKVKEAWDSGWESDLAQREEQLKALRHSRTTIPRDLRRGEEISRTWKRVVGPLAQQWQDTMKQAGRPTPAMKALHQELVDSRGSRPGRHWAGRILHLRLFGLRTIHLGLVLGKILFVVLLALGLIYLLMEWTSGLGFF